MKWIVRTGNSETHYGPFDTAEEAGNFVERCSPTLSGPICIIMVRSAKPLLSAIDNGY